MKILPYPPDGGLKRQVRDYNDTLSIFTIIRKHFRLEKAS